MTAVVRDLRGVTHVAIRLPEEEREACEMPVISALCEATAERIFPPRREDTCLTY